MLSDMPDIIAIAKNNNAVVDVELVKSLNERIESSSARTVDGPIKISGEFRTILDKAEALAGDAKVEPSHLIQAAWPTIKKELAPFLPAGGRSVAFDTRGGDRPPGYRSPLEAERGGLHPAALRRRTDGRGR